MMWIMISAVAVVACKELLAPAPDGLTAVTRQTQAEQALAPNADTYISSGYPSANYGTESVLRVHHVQPDRTTRALLAWDPQAIRQAAGGDSVVAARIELSIVANGGGWAVGGSQLGLHSMWTPWNETSATWSCPNADCFPPWNMSNPTPCDEVHGAPEPDCWEPWNLTATDTTVIANGLTGVISFDVTRDVVRYLQGTFWPNVNAWLIRKVSETSSGAVDFGSRESGSPPRLVLTLVPKGPTSQVPPVAPDTVPKGFFAAENMRMGTACMSGRTLRGIVVVSFKEGTTQPEKQAAIDLIGGEVVGGVRSRSDIEGWYYVRVEDDPEGQILCDAIEALNALPQVSNAGPELFAVSLTLAPGGSSPVPPVPPDTVPGWLYDHVTTDSPLLPGPTFLTNIAFVVFEPGTSQAQRQAAIDSVRGIVVGGLRVYGDDGYYIVLIEDSHPTVPGQALLEAVELLNGLSQVGLARPEVILSGVEDQLRPGDGAGRQQDSWSLPAHTTQAQEK